MRQENNGTNEPFENSSSPVPENDYSPHVYTLREGVVFGLKLFAAVGILMLFLWLF
jgi:hypothetical protein